MALEEELAVAEKKQVKEEKKKEKLPNPDDLTDEQIEAVKELEKSLWWEVLKDCMKKRIEKQEKDLLTLAKEHFLDPKKMGYTAFEVLGGFINWMGEMERLVNVLVTDPEEVQKAIKEVNDKEKEMVEWKWE